MRKIKIVHNKLLGGWFIVTGPHQTPIGGRFDAKAAAIAHLNRRKPTAAVPLERNPFYDHVQWRK